MINMHNVFAGFVQFHSVFVVQRNGNQSQKPENNDLTPPPFNLNTAIKLLTSTWLPDDYGSAATMGYSGVSDNKPKLGDVDVNVPTTTWWLNQYDIRAASCCATPFQPLNLTNMNWIRHMIWDCTENEVHELADENTGRRNSESHCAVTHESFGLRLWVWVEYHANCWVEWVLPVGELFHGTFSYRWMDGWLIFIDIYHAEMCRV